MAHQITLYGFGPSRSAHCRWTLQELDLASFLVEDRSSATDIVVGWTLNWGRRMGQLDGFEHLAADLKRLFARPLCPLNQE